jgi:superoxide reductase
MGRLFVCGVCGHVAFGTAPEFCPVCHSPKDKFAENAEAIKPAEKEGKEKHVPVVAVTKGCGLIPGACQDVHIKVGSIPHPMTAEHSIQWIDVYLNKIYVARYMLTPASLQAAVSVHFKTDQQGTVTVIEHCNLHGTWSVEAVL